MQFNSCLLGMKVLRLVFIMNLLFVQKSCYRNFQLRIPNGEHVKHPCIPGYLWHGVGHRNMHGGGDRNQFGLDFYGQGAQWTEELCMMDSDADGRTNGEELGDPNCTWTPDDQIVLPEGDLTFTHPGVCEPIGSEMCSNYNDWVSCEYNQFDCDAVNEPGVTNITVRLPSLKVPTVRTSHFCVVVAFPADRDYHIIAAEAILNHTEIMHHVVLFGCNPSVKPPHPPGEVFFCDSNMSDLGSCRDHLTTWFLGSSGTCLHDSNGIRVGPGGYKYGAMQVHWENIELKADLYDNSGLIVYIKPNLRANDAGVFVVGQEGLEIPPGSMSHTETGVCSSQCTSRNFREDIYLTFGLNHMHYLGYSMCVMLYRDGKFIQAITNDEIFHYDSFKTFRYDNPIQVKPGDEIRVNCTYKSTSRDATTIYGIGYLGEMCYGYLTYFPKQAIRGVPQCHSYKNIDWCSLNLDQSVNGCDVSALHDITNPNTKAIYYRMMHFCRPFGPCYDECLDVIKDVRKNPCFHGEVHEYGRWLISRNETEVNKRLKFTPFYAAMHSCDVRLASPDDVTSKESVASRPLLQHWLLGILLLFAKFAFFP